MPRASRKPIRKDLSKDLQNSFVSLIASLKNPTDIKDFLQSFLTKEENIMLSKRLMLHVLLKRNYATSQIESFLGVSRETVRIHKGIWENSGATHKKIIHQITQKQKAKQFWKKIEAILKPVDLFLKAKTDMKARAKFASGDWYNES